MNVSVNMTGKGNPILNGIKPGSCHGALFIPIYHEMLFLQLLSLVHQFVAMQADSSVN